jgi:hypothetical protein
MIGLFRSRWWVVFAAVCGLIVGAGPINVFAFGVFLKPITEAGCLVFLRLGPYPYPAREHAPASAQQEIPA